MPTYTLPTPETFQTQQELYRRDSYYSYLDRKAACQFLSLMMQESQILCVLISGGQYGDQVGYFRHDPSKCSADEYREDIIKKMDVSVDSANYCIEAGDRNKIPNINVFASMHHIDDRLYYLAPDRFVTTKPALHYVRRYRWVCLNINSKNVLTIVPSDNAEVLEAHDGARRLAYALSDQRGFPAPVYAHSGNGAHLLYRIELEHQSSINHKAICGDIKDIIYHPRKVLDFGDRNISLDVSASELIRLYGTVNAKGANHPLAPWRVSKILYQPETMVPLTPAKLSQLA